MYIRVCAYVICIYVYVYTCIYHVKWFLYQMELNDELFRLTDVATEAIYPDAMIADCYIYLFNLANKVHCTYALTLNIHVHV